MEIDAVDPHFGVPAFAWDCRLPVLFDGGAFGKEYQDAFEVCENQTSHHRVQTVLEDFGVFDAEDQNADGAFEKPNVQEEEYLRHPGEEIDILVFLRRYVHSMTSISVVYGDDLDCGSSDC